MTPECKRPCEHSTHTHMEQAAGKAGREGYAASTGTYLGTALLEAHRTEKQREGKMVTDKGNILNRLSKTKTHRHREGSRCLQFHPRRQGAASCPGKATGAETRPPVSRLLTC